MKEHSASNKNKCYSDSVKLVGMRYDIVIDDNYMIYCSYFY